MYAKFGNIQNACVLLVKCNKEKQSHGMQWLQDMLFENSNKFIPPTKNI